MGVVLELSFLRSVLGEVKYFGTCSLLSEKKKKKIPAICAIRFPEMETKLN